MTSPNSARFQPTPTCSGNLESANFAYLVKLGKNCLVVENGKPLPNVMSNASEIVATVATPSEIVAPIANPTPEEIANALAIAESFKVRTHSKEKKSEFVARYRGHYSAASRNDAERAFYLALKGESADSLAYGISIVSGMAKDGHRITVSQSKTGAVSLKASAKAMVEPVEKATGLKAEIAALKAEIAALKAKA
jgi:hypothetical protein